MSKTHWKKLHNPDYLGAYAIDDGQDLVVTIQKVQKETITGADGKKEEGIVCHLVGQKPMILNVTNAKSISKVLKSPHIEDWQGKKIQLYVDKVKAFGEIVEALRVRNFEPKEAKPIQCEECKKSIATYGKMSAEQVAQYTKSKYGKTICTECAGKIAEKAKSEEPEPQPVETGASDPTGGDE